MSNNSLGIAIAIVMVSMFLSLNLLSMANAQNATILEGNELVKPHLDKAVKAFNSGIIQKH